jgi:Transposase DDE domain
VVGEVRRSLGRNVTTSFISVDAPSVKNTDTAENKGFDGGKLVSGIKRHIGVDTNGIPHAIHVTTANVADRTGALAAFTADKDALSDVRTCLLTAAIQENLLPRAFAKDWGQRLKLPNGASRANSRPFPNGGVSNALSRGAKNAVGSGKTARAS